MSTRLEQRYLSTCYALASPCHHLRANVHTEAHSVCLIYELPYMGLGCRSATDDGAL
jgi:hypothetical protein